MRYLKAEVFFLLVFVTDYIRTELDPDGKNVCLTTENYKETVMVKVQKKKSDKRWCWKLRCSGTTHFYEDEPQVFIRTRIVAKCCNGYKEEVGQTDCVPACLKECKNGKCVAPDTCACEPGFHGLECDKECPEGWWGVNCVNKCDCSDNGKCNKEKGCECKPGWTGDRCDLPCQEGYYGYSCEEKCKCDLACNHETGECTTNTLISAPKAAANHDLGISTNAYQTTEKDQNSASEETERNQISVPETSGRLKTKIFTEVVGETGSRSGEDIKIEDEIKSEITAFKETQLPHYVTPKKKTTQLKQLPQETIQKERIGVIKSMREDAISAKTVQKTITESFATYSATTEETTQTERPGVTKSMREDTISTKTVQKKITEPFSAYSAMTEETTQKERIGVTKNIREDAISANATQKTVTEPFATYSTTTENLTKETSPKEIDIKFRMQNEINFLEGLETSVRNVSIKDTETTEFATEVSRGDTVDKTIINNKTFWIAFTNAQQPDTDETDNLINSEKGSAPKDYLKTKFHFCATLSILSGISLIIFVIAARWAIVSHKRRVQKFIVTTQKEKMLHTEQGKGQTQNSFWVNGCVENPTYLPDVDINKTVPILQTFKPVNEEAAN